MSAADLHAPDWPLLVALAGCLAVLVGIAAAAALADVEARQDDALADWAEDWELPRRQVIEADARPAGVILAGPWPELAPDPTGVDCPERHEGATE